MRCQRQRRVEREKASKLVNYLLQTMQAVASKKVELLALKLEISCDPLDRR